MGLGFNGTTAGYSPAYSPFTYTGAQAAGQVAGATAGQLVRGVAAPVVGFSQGLFGGKAMLVGIAVLAVVLINAGKNR